MADRSEVGTNVTQPACGFLGEKPYSINQQSTFVCCINLWFKLLDVRLWLSRSWVQVSVVTSWWDSMSGEIGTGQCRSGYTVSWGLPPHTHTSGCTNKPSIGPLSQGWGIPWYLPSFQKLASGVSIIIINNPTACIGEWRATQQVVLF